MTAGQAVKQHCQECLGANTGGTAYDCGSELCPLYRAMPFRGRLLPVTQRPGVWVGGERVVNYDEAAETARLADLLRRFPRRRPSPAICVAMCRECTGQAKDGGGKEDCRKVTCAMHDWQPYQPGGRRRRQLTGGALEKATERGRALARKSRLSGPEVLQGEILGHGAASGTARPLSLAF